MKDRILDANFPRTADQRVYHLGLRAGEVANRIITVGSASRAESIASFLDPAPKTFKLASERGFITITGRYKTTPISIVSIGMGSPNVDFFIREVRECLSGDMVVIRLGSCGCLTDLPVGTMVVPTGSVSVTRNYDYDFATGATEVELPYRISKPVYSDSGLHLAVKNALERILPSHSKSQIVADTMNASADSFYSSQGRQTSFPDHNANLIEHLQSSVNNLATLEMETFHIFHLAASWQGTNPETQAVPPPLATSPVQPDISQSQSPSTQASESTARKSRIKAAAAQMVFASRSSQDFITPEEVAELERWSGTAILEALKDFEIHDRDLHEEAGSVWELK